MSLPPANQNNSDLVDQYDYHQRPTRARAAAFVAANLPPGPPTNQHAALGHHLAYHSSRYDEAAAAQNSAATTAQARRMQALQTLWENWPNEKWFPDGMFSDQYELPAMVASHAASMTKLWCQRRSAATLWDACWGDYDARGQIAPGFFTLAMREAQAIVLTVPVAAEALRKLKVSLGIDYNQGRGAHRGRRRRPEPEPEPEPEPAPVPAPESEPEPEPEPEPAPTPAPASEFPRTSSEGSFDLQLSPAGDALVGAFGSPAAQTPPPVVGQPFQIDEDDDMVIIPDTPWLPRVREIAREGGVEREGFPPGVLWIEFDQICNRRTNGPEASEAFFKWLLESAEDVDTGIVLSQGVQPGGDLFVWVGVRPDG
ncbi:hypothetical protein CSUB01_12107 [Colletotrichum sublineola]|uniref:Uncharacterized protein n=1 Tax=Colletotrichum sublineola TaxID=1173701 RepID=A0A066XSG8_COLSU|nr:hypothetical protein CSUB01_12107 [Colletotrichum sublineola]